MLQPGQLHFPQSFSLQCFSLRAAFFSFGNYFAIRQINVIHSNLECNKCDDTIEIKQVYFILVEYTYFFRIFYKRLFHGDIRLCWKSLFRSNTKSSTTTDKADYKEPSPNTNTNYQELNPNTVYQELNPNTIYQALKLPNVDENEYQNTTL